MGKIAKEIFVINSIIAVYFDCRRFIDSHFLIMANLVATYTFLNTLHVETRIYPRTYSSVRRRSYKLRYGIHRKTTVTIKESGENINMKTKTNRAQYCCGGRATDYTFTRNAFYTIRIRV